MKIMIFWIVWGSMMTALILPFVLHRIWENRG
jgi:hypothetical protein